MNRSLLHDWEYDIRRCCKENIPKEMMDVAENIYNTAYQSGVTEVLNKIGAEITNTSYVNSLIFGKLMDFRIGKISADNVTEEFNRTIRLEILKILDKFNTESEVE